MQQIFFNGWEAMLRTAVLAVCAYVGMLLMVRVAGQRTLAKMNAFDFIVTIALGSTLASVITSRNIALAQGLLAFLLLVGMQYLLSFATSRRRDVERAVNGEPVLLFLRGRFLEQAMNSSRINREDIKAGLRQQGVGSLTDVEAVVLETNGRLSVVKKPQDQPASALDAVPGPVDRDSDSGTA